MGRNTANGLSQRSSAPRQIPSSRACVQNCTAPDGAMVSEAGIISVLKAQGNWEILSSHDLEERTVATPVLADGKIYLRTEKAMYCFGTR